jgi:hypothetical protein
VPILDEAELENLVSTAVPGPEPAHPYEFSDLVALEPITLL